jgi:hypothetical protein
MVDLVQQYDPEAEASSFDQVPAGTYECQIIESDREPVSTREDKGDTLKLCWKVMSGEFEGRLIWQRIMLWYSGAEKEPGKVVQIANQQFAAVREATGKKIINNSDELHFIPCLVTVGPQKNDPQYNEVKKVAAAGGAPARQVGRTNAAPQAANSGERAPWPRRA